MAFYIPDQLTGKSQGGVSLSHLVGVVCVGGSVFALVPASEFRQVAMVVALPIIDMSHIGKLRNHDIAGLPTSCGKTP